MAQSGLKYIVFIACLLCSGFVNAQDFNKEYSEFKKQSENNYHSFRNECNIKYADFLRTSWDWYSGKKPLPLPKEETPLPPRPYLEEQDNTPITVSPQPINPIDIIPQPKPIEPIREVPQPNQDYFPVQFYELSCNIRLPKQAKSIIKDCSPNSIAAGWEGLCTEEMNNTIRDCLETRIRYDLCDWAYLLFLDELSIQYCSDKNSATLLMAFLYCQSGYQMRLAVDRDNLCMLYGSKHQIYDKGYFSIDDLNFYPFSATSNSLSICNAKFVGETPMSLIIDKEQLLGVDMSAERTVTAERNKNMSITSHVPQRLIEFYNTYPTSALDGNPMTRWAMYANTPLAQKTKDKMYPSLRKCISKDDRLQAAEMLLNWVQTGFVYEYDDKVWGHDRAFFAEETLYYPYCDCEDRSILFSRLIRDLLDLDVALIYYPGHLATAVCFDQEVAGDAMIIGGRKFIVCDPTYIGAPVGAQMPDLEYDKAQAIVLNK